MSRFFKFSIVASILAAALFFLMMANFFKMISSFSQDSWDLNPDLHKPHIAQLKLEGPILSSEMVLQQLEKIKKQENCKGLLVRLETPGGAVAASQEIFHGLKDLKKKNFPVVISMANTAASGGYYVSLAGSRVFANAGTLTGSIGVIAQFPELKNLLNKVGVSMSVIKSGKLKDAGSPFKRLSPDEQQYFQDVIDDTYGQFFEDVLSARELSREALTRVADGRVLTGAEAVRTGLVDTLGTLSDARKYILQESNLNSDAPFIDPQPKQMKWLETLSSRAPFSSSQLTQTISQLFPSGLYYLWPQGLGFKP